MAGFQLNKKYTTYVLFQIYNVLNFESSVLNAEISTLFLKKVHKKYIVLRVQCTEKGIENQNNRNKSTLVH